LRAAASVAGTRLIAGVDEVGRGPLAGPVVAAAVILLRPLDGLADSKTLPALERERLAGLLLGRARIGVGAASVVEIDRINILQASLLAMRRAVLRLGCLPDLALIDGNKAPELPCPADSSRAGSCSSRAAPDMAALQRQTTKMSSSAQAGDAALAAAVSFM
jgi:ribonuclease HII